MVEIFSPEERSQFKKQFNERIKNKSNAEGKKRRAQSLLRKAVACEFVKRPSVCSECGKHAQIHAHHPDYDKPLDVIWLCGSCHNRLHGVVGHKKYDDDMQYFMVRVTREAKQAMKIKLAEHGYNAQSLLQELLALWYQNPDILKPLPINTEIDV
jgi:hypothetical protein